jgi:hypothetical protein
METPQDHHFQYPTVRPVTDISGRRYKQGTYIPPEMMHRLPELEEDAKIYQFPIKNVAQASGSQILRHIPEFQTDEILREQQSHENESGHIDRSSIIPDA